VWFSQAPEHAGAFYGRLREGGVDAQRRIGDDTAEHPDLAVTGRRVGVVWKEFDGQRSRLRAMVSEDAGQSWREHDLASTADASDQPRILAREGRFYAFWHTRPDPLQVFPIP
jgi:hypothetical protein